ncbi:hypothetical protein D9757_000558 [Collybiopsis confluens]|uniref:Glycoside hydrolase family 76 protein n=1 Tax=Collybiopsis confluens TaxID=2823264 RepID=A0A8H5MH44_9AGAR|nr:hypothetical protein D9757_000558 [Collybiopsis confluens]
MLGSSKKVLPLFASFLVMSAQAANVPRTELHKRAQCAATLSVAESVASTLQAHYYVSSSGMYNGGSLWTDANAVEDLHNLMLGANVDTWSTVGQTSWIGKNALNPSTNWNSIINGANDDAGWIVLALWKIADYKSARGQSATAYLNAAATIYNMVAGQWDDTCGGGVW